jgi:dephospho-CoA kinase
VKKRWPDKIIVGLTGNIATGKSTVMDMAEQRGALTLDADKVVHQILETDPHVQGVIAERFGPGVRHADSSIDRDALAAIVFSDPVALATLERIVHPEVRKVILGLINGSQARIIFIEAIKLLEGGLAATCDQIWVTRCPMETQIDRLMTYRGLTRETAKQRVTSQSAQEAKVALADIVIDTSGSMESTQAYFEVAWRSLFQTLPSPSEKGRTQGSDLMQAGAPPNDSQELFARRYDKHVSDDQLNQFDVVAREILDHDDADNVIVRRARLADIPALMLLIKKATGDETRIGRGELLLALGRRGYLIGQQGTEISVVAGWSAQRQVATIEEFFVYPAEATKIAGPAVLHEIEHTANELICEVLFATLSETTPRQVRLLLEDAGYGKVAAEALPKAWQKAVLDLQTNSSILMMKQLRDTRVLSTSADEHESITRLMT